MLGPWCQGDCALRGSRRSLLLIIFPLAFVVMLMEQFREAGRAGVEEERGSLPQEQRCAVLGGGANEN